MNTYTYEELTIGMKCSFEVSVTQEMMKQFQNITGDDNPLHNDNDFAVARGFQGEVVYGMLTASFMSTIAGMYLPGERSLIHSMEGKFLKPAYVGETLTVCGEVKDKNDLFRLIELVIIIYNDKKEKIYKGKMKVGIIDE